MRLLPILAIVAITIPTHAQQEVQFGVKLGPNLSTLSEPIGGTQAPKLDYHIGIFLRRQSTEKLAARPEVYFSRQGQVNKFNSGGQSAGQTTTTISAINVPLLIEYGGKLSIHFGPQFGILLHAFEEGERFGSKYYEDQRELINQADWSAVLGGSLNLTDKMHIGVRYNYGITTNFHTKPHAGSIFVDQAPRIANRVFHFYVGYAFR